MFACCDGSMLLKASVCRLLSRVSIVCGGVIALSAGAVQAQSLPEDMVSEPSPSEGTSLVLLPLEPVTMTVTHDAGRLDAVAQDMNTQMVAARSQPEEPTGFSLEQLPIVGDLVDEEGNFDWGMDLPVSVNVGDVLGSYGVTVDMDFSL